MRRMLARVLFFSFLVAGCGEKKAPPPTPKAAPSAAPIPTTPIDGKVSGKAFTPKKMTMVTAKGYGEWRVTLEGVVSGGETTAIRFPVRSPLAAGKVVDVNATGIVPGAKAMAISIQSGTGSTTTSNASYRVEITRWEVKPCPDDGASTHEGGHASGRLHLRVPSEDVEVAGTFEDAVVSYGPTPDWEYR